MTRHRPRRRPLLTACASEPKPERTPLWQITAKEVCLEPHEHTMTLAELGAERWREIKLCAQEFYYASLATGVPDRTTVEVRRNPFPFPWQRPAVTCTPGLGGTVTCR